MKDYTARVTIMVVVIFLICYVFMYASVFYTIDKRIININDSVNIIKDVYISAVDFNYLARHSGWEKECIEYKNLTQVCYTTYDTKGEICFHFNEELYNITVNNIKEIYVINTTSYCSKYMLVKKE